MERAKQILRDTSSAQINISPMIDLVFILLIFFVVAAVFVEESGFEVETPDSKPIVEDMELPPLGIFIDASNRTFMGEEPVSKESIRAKVAHRVAMNPKLGVIVRAAPSADAGLMIEVLDQVRQGGIDIVSLALDGD